MDSGRIERYDVNSSLLVFKFPSTVDIVSVVFRVKSTSTTDSIISKSLRPDELGHMAEQEQLSPDPFETFIHT